MMRRLQHILLISLLILSLLTSCNGDKEQSSATLSSGMESSHLLRMEQVDSTLTIVTVRNPWDTTANLAKYALLDRSLSSHPAIPQGTDVIKVPLESSVVFSGVHASLIKELGNLSNIKGVCDTQYLRDEDIIEQVKSGKILDCGNSMQPNIEMIIRSAPGAVIISNGDGNVDISKYKAAGIPAIMAVDYMESTPLGRAEWMKFYGRLFGKGHQADSLYTAVSKRYFDLREKATTQNSRPAIIFDKIYGGTWYVPTSGSATGHMIADAGASNPFADYSNSGSAALTPEEVLLKGGTKADIWLVRHNEGATPSLKSLSAENPLYAKLKPVRERCVYAANTSEVPIFEDAAFHPDLVLSEMVKIAHPEIAGSEPLKYYKKVE